MERRCGMSHAIICDKCDRILPPFGNYRILMPMVQDGPMEVRDGEQEPVHLCYDCFEAVYAWIEERDEG